MEAKKISDGLSVSPQISADDIKEIARLGFRSIICNRPDGEGSDQPTFDEITKAASDAGLETRYLPIVSGKVTDQNADEFGSLLGALPGPVFAYCRTGTRSATLWSLSQASRLATSEILRATKAAGYDMGGVVRRIVNGGKTPTDQADAKYDVVIVGGGAAGISI
ncbi:MAG: TIGR01244 family phosphatase, partial [Thalassospira sp.]|nr:TIGR01244 family phosphatase [Thalassospira sp.]